MKLFFNQASRYNRDADKCVHVSFFAFNNGGALIKIYNKEYTRLLNFYNGIHYEGIPWLKFHRERRLR